MAPIIAIRLYNLCHVKRCSPSKVIYGCSVSSCIRTHTAAAANNWLLIDWDGMMLIAIAYNHFPIWMNSFHARAQKTKRKNLLLIYNKILEVDRPHLQKLNFKWLLVAPIHFISFHYWQFVTTFGTFFLFCFKFIETMIWKNYANFQLKWCMFLIWKTLI